MGADEYAEQIIDQFIHEITDNLFLFIEQNDEIMREYMTNVNRYGLGTLNETLGLKIKEMLHLGNDGDNNSPKSRLIKKYTYHTRQG